jgi:ribosome-interacting GTPase 1
MNDPNTRQVIAVAKSSDLVMMVLDAGAETKKNHRQILERELESVGLRLNKRPPNVTFRKKKLGGIKFNATVALTQVG